MRSRIAILLVSLCLCTFVRGADEENPYARAKVGDWVAYKMSTKMAGHDMTMEQKQTVTKKTDTEVTIEAVMKTPAGDQTSSYTVNLKDKYDPNSEMKKMAGEGMVFKELAKGDETVTIAGKPIKTTWVQFESNGKVSAGGQSVNVSQKGKFWRSSDVPLGGLVKSESEMQMGKMSMELTGFGSK